MAAIGLKWMVKVRYLTVAIFLVGVSKLTNPTSSELSTFLP